MKKSTIVTIISLLFIFLFIYAAASKLLDSEKFRVQIGKSPLLTNIAGLVAWFIPAIEISISILLALQRFRLIALYASFSLMVMFTAYIIAILKFSDNIPCSCGGILQNMSWSQHLIFNIGFVILALIGIILQSEKGFSTIKGKQNLFT